MSQGGTAIHFEAAPPAAAEQLSESEPVGDVTLQQAEASESATVPEEKVYQVTHGNGRTFEGTLAAAKEVCPVLARMSMQEAGVALAGADIAESLAARGRAKRLAAAEGGKAKQEPATQRSDAAAGEKAAKHNTYEPSAVSAEKLAVEEGLATTALSYLQTEQANTVVTAEETTLQTKASLPPSVQSILAEAEVRQAFLSEWQDREVNQAGRLYDEASAAHAGPAQVRAMELETNIAAIRPISPDTVVPELFVETAVDPGLADHVASETVPGAFDAGTEADADTLSVGFEYKFTDIAVGASDHPAVETVTSPSEQLDTASGIDDELENEPLELYDELTRALHALVVAAELPSEDDDSVEAAVELQAAIEADTVVTLPESEPVPAVAVAVVEQLDELEPAEKETVAPMLQAIVTAAQAVETAKTTGAEPESIESATAQLEEQITALLEHLHITYEPEDIELFGQMLLRPEFYPLQPSAAAIKADLEKDGTREANWSLKLAQGWADAKKHVKQALGGSALFHAHNSKTQYGLAA